jgi:hypothetical protein
MGIEWLNPAALLGLLALPVLYWLSRQQPKPPTEQPFAGVVLLQPPPHSVPPPVRTALWRLLCRAGFVAALILAAAQPQQPAPQLALPAGQKTLVLLDNTLWATPAAAFIQEQLTVLTRMAGEQGHSLVVRGLAPTTDGQLPEATAALRAQPFDTLSRAETGDYSRVVVFSSGWMSRASVDFLKTLTPPVEIIAAPVQSRAHWRLLTDKIALMGRGALSDNPPVAVNGADGLRLPGIQGLWSWNPQQKSAPPRLGLIDMGSAAPLSNLSDAVPYLETAAKQFGGFSRGTPSRLVAEGVSLFLWPGSIVLDDAELKALTAALEAGGVVLRLADAALLNEGTELLPVRLRPTLYDASGAYSGLPAGRWGDTAADSVLAAMPAAPDVVCPRYLLAEPDAGALVWARFDNGAPLVSAAKVGKGWTVLLHTALEPSWCSLAYSEAWLGLLERFLMLSKGSSAEPVAATTELTLSERVDAETNLEPAKGAPLRLTLSALKTEPPSVAAPFGRYTAADGASVWRMDGALLPPVTALEALPGAPFTIAPPLLASVEYWPLLLMLALFFVLLEGFISWRVLRLLPFALLVLASSPAQAAEAASGYKLCARAADEPGAALSLKGLEQLSAALRLRTNLQPDAPQVWRTAPPIEDMAGCLFVYWRLSGQLTAADAAWLRQVVSMMGLVVLDGYDPNGFLSSLVHAAGLPPLRPVPEDFVVTRSFYRISPLQGQLAAPLYYSLMGTGNAPQDFAPVFAGSVDFASAWAEPGSPAHELALRSGINLAMYATTGTYKDDNVHRDALFKRWQQDDKGGRR